MYLNIFGTFFYEKQQLLSSFMGGSDSSVLNFTVNFNRRNG